MLRDAACEWYVSCAGSDKGLPPLHGKNADHSSNEAITSANSPNSKPSEWQITDEEEPHHLNWSGESSVIEYEAQQLFPPINLFPKRPIPNLIAIKKVEQEQNGNHQNRNVARNLANPLGIPLQRNKTNCEIPNFASHPLEYAEYLRKKVSIVLSDAAKMRKG